MDSTVQSPYKITIGGVFLHEMPSTRQDISVSESISGKGLQLLRVLRYSPTPYKNILTKSPQSAKNILIWRYSCFPIQNTPVLIALFLYGGYLYRVFLYIRRLYCKSELSYPAAIVPQDLRLASDPQ